MALGSSSASLKTLLCLAALPAAAAAAVIAHHIYTSRSSEKAERDVRLPPMTETATALGSSSGSAMAAPAPEESSGAATTTGAATADAATDHAASSTAVDAPASVLVSKATAVRKSEKSSVSSSSWSELVEDEETFEMYPQLRNVPENGHSLDENQLSSKLSNIKFNPDLQRNPGSLAQDSGVASPASPEHAEFSSRSTSDHVSAAASAVKSAKSSRASSGGCSSGGGGGGRGGARGGGGRGQRGPSLEIDGGLGGSLCGGDDERHEGAGSDSGRGSEGLGGSHGEQDRSANQIFKYQFNITNSLCGKLIGAKGQVVQHIRKESGCSLELEGASWSLRGVGGGRGGSNRRIAVPPNERPANELQVCSVQGTRAGIDYCLDLIRDRFPLDQFPDLTLEQTNAPSVPGGESDVTNGGSAQLTLTQGQTQDLVVSAIVSAGQVFVQRASHPSHRFLRKLTTCMTSCYERLATPPLPRPIDDNVIAVAPAEDGRWYRVTVVSSNSATDCCDVKFLDYGGYTTVNASDLKQIRKDFLTLPFQAIEAYLGNVMPLDSLEWSLESGAVLEDIVKNSYISGRMLGVAEDMKPMLHLYANSTGEFRFVNRELVERGVAAWVEHQSAGEASSSACSETSGDAMTDGTADACAAAAAAPPHFAAATIDAHQS